MKKAAVSEKGQVTIPKAIRERLGLRPGTLLEFCAEGGRLIGTKAVAEDVFRKWRGSGRLPKRGLRRRASEPLPGPRAHRR